MTAAAAALACCRNGGGNLQQLMLSLLLCYCFRQALDKLKWRSSTKSSTQEGMTAAGVEGEQQLMLSCK
jgi:hypothetical protein